MAREQAKFQINNFTGGLVTDFHPLNQPDNTTTDELNCAILKNGSRRRRRGFATSTLSDYDWTTTSLQPIYIDTYLWENVNNLGNLDFTVLQIGNLLYLYDNGDNLSFSSRKTSVVDLNDFKAPGAGAVANYPISVASGKGALFVTGQKVNPFYMSYNNETGALTTTSLTIQIRDFELQDTTDPETSTASLSVGRKYDLFNQGWYLKGIKVDNIDYSGAILFAYKNITGVYPPKTKPWWVGKRVHTDIDTKKIRHPGIFNDEKVTIENVTEHMDTQAYAQYHGGNTVAPIGHYLLNVFYKDRRRVSGVSLPVETTDERPRSVAFYAGRAWWGFKNKIFFSQLLLKDLSIAGRCYQEADPTHEEINDLIDTDGGELPIPEMGNAVHQMVVGSNLLIFADNGIWMIGSGDGTGFKATDYAITNITKIGALSSRSIVNVEGLPYWWSDSGIYRLTYNDTQRGFVAQDITNKTSYPQADRGIQQFYRQITTLAKRNCKGAYDPYTKTIHWLYREDDAATAFYDRFKYNQILNYNLNYGAFYPYSIATTSSDGVNTITNYIAGVFSTNLLKYVTDSVTVFDASGNTVTDASSQNVVATLNSITSNSDNMYYLYFAESTSTPDAFAYAFGRFANTNVQDWITGSYHSQFDSYMFVAWHKLPDYMTYMQAPYIYAYFTTSELSEFDFDPEGDPDSVYETSRSSCKLRVLWDFASSSNTSKKWSRETEIYRVQRSDETDPEYISVFHAHQVMVTKNKVRGKGRVLQIYFYNNPDEISSTFDYDFNLVGWGVMLSKNAGA